MYFFTKWCKNGWEKYLFSINILYFKYIQFKFLLILLPASNFNFILIFKNFIPNNKANLKKVGIVSQSKESRVSGYGWCVGWWGMDVYGRLPCTSRSDWLENRAELWLCCPERGESLSLFLFLLRTPTLLGRCYWAKITQHCVLEVLLYI